MTRRSLLFGAFALTAGAIAGLGLGRKHAAATEHFEVSYTPQEWKQRLTAEQFYVLREQGTELAFTSALNHETRTGAFHCAGCDLPVFSSATKFDSGTGWPSFWAPLPKAVAKSPNGSPVWGIEVHCRRCGGHLGHVFDDGPKPTGLRYCINGVALKFMPTS